MAKRLMYVPLGKFGGNGVTDLHRTHCTVFLQRWVDGMLHALAGAPTKLARPFERRALPDQQRHVVAHPVASVVLRCRWFLTGGFQVLKGLRKSSRSSLGGSFNGNSWRFLRYAFSCLFPVRMVAMTDRWSEL